MGRIYILLGLFVTGIIAVSDCAAAPFTASVEDTKIITPTREFLKIRVDADTSLPSYDTMAVEGRIYSVTGREVGLMQVEPGHDFYTDGWIRLLWDIGSYPSGVYIYQLRGAGQVYNGSFVVAR